MPHKERLIEKSVVEGRKAEDRKFAETLSLGLEKPHRFPLHNRVKTLMIHTTRYAFQGQARLATDTGVSRSTISRMLGGKTNPSYHLVQAVTEALSKHLKRPLQPCDLFSATGHYKERSGCTISGCHGCLPEEAYDHHGNLRSAWKNAHPGDWSCSPKPASSTAASTA